MKENKLNLEKIDKNSEYIEAYLTRYGKKNLKNEISFVKLDKDLDEKTKCALDVEIMQSLLAKKLGIEVPSFNVIETLNSKYVVKEPVAINNNKIDRTKIESNRFVLSQNDMRDSNIIAKDYHNFIAKDYNMYLEEVLEGKCSILESNKVSSIINNNKNSKHEGMRPVDIIFDKRLFGQEENPMLKVAFTEQGVNKLFKTYMIKLACFSNKNNLNTIMYLTDKDGKIEDVKLLSASTDITSQKVFDKKRLAAGVKYETPFSQKRLKALDVLNNIAKNNELKGKVSRFDIRELGDIMASELDASKIAEEFENKTSYEFSPEYKKAVQENVKNIGEGLSMSTSR